jgi:hypothetical protein
VTAGESAFFPRGIPHQLMNPSDNHCRHVLIDTPALFDQFIKEDGPDEVFGPPTAKGIERLRATCPRFGITLLSNFPTPQ